MDEELEIVQEQTEPVADIPAAPVEQEEKQAGRDFEREVRTLLEVFPELAGEELPEEVAQRAAMGENLVAAYRRYERDKTEARSRVLEKEKSVLQHNAEAALRAPVSGLTGGMPVEEKAEDDFLKGFHSEA